MSDRYSISRGKRNIIEEMKDTQYLGKISPMDIKNKDLFLYTMALGKGIPTDLVSKDQWFENGDMSIEEEAIVYAIAYNELNNVEKLQEFETVKIIVERMSNAGFDIVEECMHTGSLDNVEKRMISELDEIYEKLSL